MTSLRRAMLGSALCFAVFSASPGIAQKASPAGTWRDSDQETELRIAPCGKDLCGTITWMKAPKTDANNPDAKLKARPLVGLTVISTLRPSAAAYIGRAYNPDDGKTYDATLAFAPDGALIVKGCALGGLICEEERWTRVR